MNERPCMLDPEKWRVAHFTVETAVDTVAVRPWQIDLVSPLPPKLNMVSVWGIWPPNWPITEQPLLAFPPGLHGWRQAYNAAWSRAQFAAVPQTRQPPEFLYAEGQPIPTEDNGNGQA